MIPRDTIAILKNGEIVDSIAYDTVIGDKTCAAGCDVNLTTPLALPYYMSTPLSLIWPAKSYEVQVKGPDSLVHTERVSETTMDSAFQVSYAGQDTATSLQHANWLCRFCPFTSLDSSSADFLVPDSSSKLIKASLLERDTVGGHRGAIGAGGALGTHVPVRLRARGMPQFSGSTLRLPVSISSETKLDGMAVRRIQVTYRDLDANGKCFIPEYAANVKLSAVQPFQPRIPSFPSPCPLRLTSCIRSTCGLSASRDPIPSLLRLWSGLGHPWPKPAASSLQPQASLLRRSRFGSGFCQDPTERRS